jgi:hypothetical protein
VSKKQEPSTAAWSRQTLDLAMKEEEPGDIEAVLNNAARKAEAKFGVRLRVTVASPGPTPMDDSEALELIEKQLARRVLLNVAISTTRIDLGKERAAARRWKGKIEKSRR